MNGIAMLVIGILLGGVLFAGGSTGLDYFESDTFCTSCHVMDDIAAQWRESNHYANASGVKAGCADCHVTPGVVGSFRSKFRALHEELWPWLRGLDTPEEMAERRVEQAESVWAHLRATDSASCRSCHQMGEATLALQSTRARSQHRDAEADGDTCIDCHDDGVAHRPIEKADAEEEDEWAEDDFTL